MPVKEWLDKEDDLHEETLRERIVDTWVQSYQAKEEQVGAPVLLPCGIYLLPLLRLLLSPLVSPFSVSSLYLNKNVGKYMRFLSSSSSSSFSFFSPSFLPLMSPTFHLPHHSL